MSKILAIKGHSTRGKEVIELLEMMGGENSLIVSGYKLSGYEPFNLYYINDNGVINYKHHSLDKDMTLFTLEEFLEKYPFKVGDVVKTGTDEEGVIKQIKWVDNDIVYWVESNKTCKWAQTLSVDVLNKYNRLESNDIEHIWATTVESNKRDREDVLFGSIIWHLRNSVNNGKQHLSGGDCEAYFRELVKKVKMYKPVYPKTYKECCERVNACPTVGISYGSNKDMLYNDDVDLTLLALRKLLICRNAYWKIAGEQMGLGKPWKPNWSDTNEEVYGIQLVTDDTNMIYHESASFTFPTEEILNEFCKNFKDLIEKCKELL